MNQEEIKIANKEIIALSKEKNNDLIPKAKTNNKAVQIIYKNNSFLDQLAKASGFEDFNNSKNKDLSLEQEINYHLSSYSKCENFSNYWFANKDKLPILSNLVKRYCIIPASSVASESAFSIANFIQRKERSALSSKNLRYSIVLRDEFKFK